MTTSPLFSSAPELIWHGRVPFAFADLSTDYAAELTKVALENEERIKRLPVTPGWEKAADANPTSARYGNYSAFLLDGRCLSLFFAVRSLYRFLLQSTHQPNPPRYIQSWCNVHRAGQHIHRHCHSSSYIGVFSACSEGSETKFGPFPVSTEHDRAFPHRNGQLMVTQGGFKNYHEVSVWQREDTPRVTYAFDIYDQSEWHRDFVMLPFDAAINEFPAS